MSKEQYNNELKQIWPPTDSRVRMAFACALAFEEQGNEEQVEKYLNLALDAEEKTNSA